MAQGKIENDGKYYTFIYLQPYKPEESKQKVFYENSNDEKFIRKMDLIKIPQNYFKSQLRNVWIERSIEFQLEGYWKFGGCKISDFLFNLEAFNNDLIEKKKGFSSWKSQFTVNEYGCGFESVHDGVNCTEELSVLFNKRHY